MVTQIKALGCRPSGLNRVEVSGMWIKPDIVFIEKHTHIHTLTHTHTFYY